MEQAWEIPFSPNEFIQEAIKQGHPRSFSKLLPGVLQKAVSKNFSQEGAGSLVQERAKFFKHWLVRAKELEAQERELKQGMDSHARNILEPKRLLLWKEMLQQAQYPDLGVFDEMIRGTVLTGEVAPCGIFDKVFKPAEITESQLKSRSKADRLANFYGCRSSGDEEIETRQYMKKRWRR